ncbi:hypothetical protein BKA82DRAFT_35194 [Pisolithus tinctorius]|uniref:Uncharacterized protein n=1 Tax=Pisolithus tinctorius Marx 270 TaxID=870435 RepID=A0A0C3J9D3_PISTI|nr:hypothetical protein BKA82DRAFT_35194 [Pisolithus tinctorius]KIN94291.1 hypothetical protein M404DRAFT_35194 [Pisolithus tinctorius Marx 270]
MDQYNEELDGRQAVEASNVNPCLDADRPSASIECAAPRVTTADAGGVGCIEGPFSDDPSYDVGGGVHRGGTMHGTEFYLQFMSQSSASMPHPEGLVDSIGFVDRVPEDVMHNLVEERQHVGGTNPED